MDLLTLFGLFAVSAMLLTYALEERSHWFVLGRRGVLPARLGLWLPAGRLPFGLVEAVWSIVAPRRWAARRPAFREKD